MRQVVLLRGGAALAVLALFVAAGCAPAQRGTVPSSTGSPAAAGGSPGSVRTGSTAPLSVTGTEFAFSPQSLTVPAGQPVTITFENRGAILHDLKTDVGIESEGAGEETNQGAIPHDSMTNVGGMHLVANAGQMVNGTYTFDQPGQYELFCSIPGHREAGMKGTLVVAAARAASADIASATPPTVAQASQPTPLPVPAGAQLLPLPRIAPPVSWTSPRVHTVEIGVQETAALVADSVATTFWTFGGTVPGPMLRVRQGDTVELTLKNPVESRAPHSIDGHAVTGPGGGAKATQIAPGQQASFQFKTLNPGVYVYHCATPMIAHHVTSGMYGLIVVEPPGGLPPVDREFYVMQGDMYLQGERGLQGLRETDFGKLLDERPDYVIFNGGVGSLIGDRALQAAVGDTVRIFFGVGGPNLPSSFHVIGEIFDRVYREAGSEVSTNVQTTLVPAGGATIVEFTLEVPGTYLLVDHSLGRVEKGAAGQFVVTGADNPSVFQPGQAGTGTGGH